MTGVAFDAPDWDRDGGDWPNREHSRFVRASAIRWHIQRLGRGPLLLALHGTGAATHTWRDLGPMLGEHFDFVAVDLPGHGFTEMPADSRLTLSGMATAVAELLEAEGLEPAIVVGHSAGAAILCRMALDHRLSPAAIISLNGALRPFPGFLGRMYPLAAQVTHAVAPVAARLIARRAHDPSTIRQLVEQVGSTLDDRGIALYQRLVQKIGHTSAAMAMMARWDLSTLEFELSRLECELVLVAGARDSAVPPAHALHLAARVPAARALVLPDVGHLSHEERPADASQIIFEAAARVGVSPLVSTVPHQ